MMRSGQGPFLNPTIQDVNQTTIALTGTPGKLIRFHSSASVTIGASAAPGASITSKSVTCGSRLWAVDGVFKQVESDTFEFEARDNRGNVAKKTIRMPFVWYTPLGCNIEDGVPSAAGELDFVVSGSMFQGSFGKVNNAVSAEYRYRKQGTTSWGEWQSMQASLTGFGYTASAKVTGLEYQTAYEFQARATDKLEQKESAIKVIKAEPIFDWSRHDFRINVPVTVEGANLVGVAQRNYFDNPFFLLNQRGRYTAANYEFVADRWFAYTATGTGIVERVYDGIKTTGDAGIFQTIENPNMMQQIVTVSVYLVDIGQLFTCTGTMPKDWNENSSYNIDDGTLPIRVTLQKIIGRPGPTVGIQAKNGHTIQAVKLELGTKQTLMRWDFRGWWSYLELQDPHEIVKCQRYFFRTAWCNQVGSSDGGDRAYFYIPTPTEPYGDLKIRFDTKGQTRRYVDAKGNSRTFGGQAEFSARKHDGTQGLEVTLRLPGTTIPAGPVVLCDAMFEFYVELM